MSHTYRLKGYAYGKPLYSTHARKYLNYRFYSHEYVGVRKELWRSFRRQCRSAIRKGLDAPIWKKTVGWITW